MARNVFISFRYSDGNKYKERLSAMFDYRKDTVDYSEDVNRSGYSDWTIRNYLYRKLSRSSVTIIILTPQAVNHKKNRQGYYDDWMYDEIRYSLEEREGNKTNGLIAIYTPETANMIIERSSSGTIYVKNVDNLFRKNMMNIRQAYKHNPEPGIYNSNYDSYCSLVAWNDFVKNPGLYIDIAIEKREVLYKYIITKRL